MEKYAKYETLQSNQTLKIVYILFFIPNKIEGIKVPDS